MLSEIKNAQKISKSDSLIVNNTCDKMDNSNAETNDKEFHGTFKKNQSFSERQYDSLWKTYQGIMIYQPGVAPWQKFVGEVKHAFQESDIQVTFGLAIDVNTKMPTLSVELASHNGVPLSMVQLKLTPSAYIVRSTITNKTEEHSIKLNNIKQLDRVLSSISQRNEHLIHTELKTKPSVHIKPQTVQAQQQEKTKASSWLNTRYGIYATAGSSISLGLGLLMYIYGKPLAGVIGRDVVACGYSLVFGEPSYSWWDPVSLWHYSNYVSAREHTGRMFYDNAETILPVIGTSLFGISTLALIGLKNGMQKLGTFVFDKFTKMFDPIEVHKEKEQFKKLCDQLEQLTLNVDEDAGTISTEQSLILFDGKPKILEEEAEPALVLVPYQTKQIFSELRI